jgi:hypothetical protein
MNAQQGLYSFNVNPELKLDYQPSMISYLSEAATSNAQSNTAADTLVEVADTEEGIKRYT